MTLKQWLAKNDNPAHRRHDNDSGVGIHDTCPDPASLWHLDDYAVESVSAGMIWLRPRAPVSIRVNKRVELTRQVAAVKRCWQCPNCGVIDKVKLSVMRAVQQAISQDTACDDAALVWNDMLAAYPCTGMSQALEQHCYKMARYCITEYNSLTDKMVEHTTPHKLATLLADFFRPLMEQDGLD